MQLTSALRAQYAALWAAMKLNPERAVRAKALAEIFVANRARYETVAQKTGVPWYFIACVHMRESSCVWHTYLGNGQSLDHVTTIVPVGRGPWISWEDGAIDALQHQGLDKVTDWSLPSLLFRFEAYNGFGYATAHHMASPYLWAWSSNYTRGKYRADGLFDPSLVDPQPGVAVLLAALRELVPDLFPVPTPAIKEQPMATATPSTSTISTVFNAAKTDLKAVTTAITGIISSAGFAMVLGLFSHLMPGAIPGVLLAVGLVAGLVSTIAHFYFLMTGLQANNNATIALFENLLNSIETGLGGKPLGFDNGTPTPIAAS